MKKFLVLLILLLMACKTVSLEILPGSPTPWPVETLIPTTPILIKTATLQPTQPATVMQPSPATHTTLSPTPPRPTVTQPALASTTTVAVEIIATATPPPAPPTPTPTAQEQAVKELADQAIQALKKGDMQTLAGLIDPARGVRFSPYAFVHEEDRRYLPNPLKRAFTDNGGEEHRQKYLWGHFDGSGLPIEMTFKQYYERFVYDQDFANAELVGVNQSFSQGNTIDNLADFYPGAMFVEYYFPGFDEKYQGMDWEALRLVFQQTVVQNTTPKDQWRLVGIIHDQWTI